MTKMAAMAINSKKKTSASSNFDCLCPIKRTSDLYELKCSNYCLVIPLLVSL